MLHHTHVIPLMHCSGSADRRLLFLRSYSLVKEEKLKTRTRKFPWAMEVAILNFWFCPNIFNGVGGRLLKNWHFLLRESSFFDQLCWFHLTGSKHGHGTDSVTLHNLSTGTHCDVKYSLGKLTQVEICWHQWSVMNLILDFSTRSSEREIPFGLSTTHECRTGVVSEAQELYWNWAAFTWARLTREEFFMCFSQLWKPCRASRVILMMPDILHGLRTCTVRARTHTHTHTKHSVWGKGCTQGCEGRSWEG